MNYASLIGDKTVAGSLADRINYVKVPAAELVKNAQDEIFARLRVREMRKSLTVTLAPGVFSAPLPSDFLDPETLFDPFGCPVKRLSDDRLLAMRAFDVNGAMLQGAPHAYGLFDEAFQFDMAAAAATTLSGMYYAATYLAPAVPASGSTPAIQGVDTSFLTRRYSNLFWAVLLKMTYGYRKEWDAATRHAVDAESLFQAIEQNDDLSYRGLDDADYAGGRL